VLLDVRPGEEFAAGHIDGALSIPLGELCDRVQELPPDLEVVAYCRGEYCVLAYDAVRMLRARGLRARRMEGGMLEWITEGRPATAQPA
jgi:rhodanese-related sulfurtransferase